MGSQLTHVALWRQGNKLESKRRSSILGTGDASASQPGALPSRPGTAPAQTSPEPIQLSRSPPSQRALGCVSASPVLDNVLEHPDEDEQDRCSDETTDTSTSSTQSTTPPPIIHESAVAATNPDTRTAAAHNGGPSGSFSAVQPADQQRKGSLQSMNSNASTSTHVGLHFASPFGTQASQPFSADAGPSTGRQH